MYSVSLRSLLLSLFLAFLAPSLHAGFIQSVEDSGTRYFLFSVPNKIETFDLETGQATGSTSLQATAQALAVSGNYAFVAHGREVRRYDLSDGSSEFVRNAGNTVSALVAINGFLVVIDGSQSVLVLDGSTFGLVDSGSIFYRGVSFAAAPSVNSIFYRTSGVSPSDIVRIKLGANGEILSSGDSPYHGDFPTSSIVRVFPGEDRVADGSGVVYNTADLSYHGSLVGSLNDLNAGGGHVVVARDDRIDRFTDSLTFVDTYETSSPVEHVDVVGDTIYAFIVDDSGFEWLELQASDFTEPQPEPVADPESVRVQYDKIAVNHSSDELYILDNGNNAVFRWDVESGDWQPGFGLISEASWMTWSASHDRLYLGYSDGRITYFDTSTNNGVEEYLMALPQAVRGLLATGDYLFAADASGAWETHYSIDADGRIVDSVDWRNTGAKYVWSAQTNRIYHFRDGTSPNDIEWTELSQTTGQFGADGDSPYHGDYPMVYPLRLSDDGSYLLTGAGHLYDATTLQQQNALSHSVVDAAWIAGRLFTLTNDGGIHLQFWSDDFERTSNSLISTTGSARILGLRDNLIIVKATEAGISIQVMNPLDLPDSDDDSIFDIQDNCPSIANPSQLDTDYDTLGDACDADDDNDFIPDQVEFTVGLNPLEDADADLDLDEDGASNLLEHLLGTDLQDETSSPELVGSFFQSFEDQEWNDGSWLLARQSGASWRRTGARSDDGDFSLFASGDDDDVAELHLKGVFVGGEMTIRVLKPEGYSSHGRLVVLLDGSQVASVQSYSSSWREYTFDVPPGEHTINFRYMVSDTYYSTYDTSIYLDSVRMVADDNDADADGVLDEVDNCPQLFNEDQSNYDGDAFGDLCDDDDDNDGLKDTVEQSFNALDPLDPSDPEKDGDNDGILNVDELLLGLSPDSADEYSPIDLRDYLRLSNHTRVEEIYAGNSYSHTRVVDWSAAGHKRWHWSSEGLEKTIEINNIAVFLVAEEYMVAPDVLVTASPSPERLFLPATISRGHRISRSSTIESVSEGELLGRTALYEYMILLDQGSVVYQGEEVDTALVRHVMEFSRVGAPTVRNVTDSLYAEGIGLLESVSSSGSRTRLVEVVDEKINTVVEEEEADSALGSLSGTVFLGLLLLGSLRIRRHSL
jgi:hypothetical protein